MAYLLKTRPAPRTPNAVESWPLRKIHLFEFTKRRITKAKMAKTHEGTATRTQHHRVTAPRGHQAPTLPGMHHASKITQAGNTTHFDVSYLTSLGKKGADLADAILQNCERDYATLEQVFGGHPKGCLSSCKLHRTIQAPRIQAVWAQTYRSGANQAAM